MESCVQKSPKHSKITDFFQKELPNTEQQETEPEQQVMPVLLKHYQKPQSLVAKNVWGDLAVGHNPTLSSSYSQNAARNRKKPKTVSLGVLQVV